MVDEKKPTALVAMPSKRDAVIERLQDHYALNHLEVADFELLVEKAERARTDSELMVLLDGLPEIEGKAALVPAKAGQLTTTVSTVLGNNTRRGRWRVPSRVKAKALLGNVELDLSEAELSKDETVIEASATFGSITITVPDGLAVECEGQAILGSFDHVEQEAASRKDPRRVRIVGKAIFGSVEVIVKQRPKSLIDNIKGLLGPITGRR